MLRAWDFNIDVYKAIARWMHQSEGVSENDTALWWLNNNVEIWSQWVTEEAAEAVLASLGAGEIPAGWPTQ